MPQNIFKIYDGRTSFWQWDTQQKLIVLDERITEVRFQNKNMAHSKRMPVYTDGDGVRICNIPSTLLQLPKNLIAYACVKNEDGSISTAKSVNFAVRRQSKPTDYVCEQDDGIENILARIELLEAMLKDVEAGNKQFIKFASSVEAEQWAVENGEPGDIVVVQSDVGWVPHVVEGDKSLSSICNCDGDDVTVCSSMPKLTTVMIPDSGWSGSSSPYSQVIAVNGVNVNSRLELLPTPAQISELQEAEISMTITNNNGVVTLYSFYGKPANTMEMQILITDVEVIS